MIIQSPELLQYKKIDALERVDKYLLILAAFKKGLTFGIKFNERQSEPNQWLFKINAHSIIGGVGDLRDFKSVILEISDFCQNMSVILGNHYITGHGVVNHLSQLLRAHFEEKASALAVNFAAADWRNESDPSLWFIDFDGSIKQLKNFAVAGGSEYEESLTPEELEKLSDEEKSSIETRKQKLMEYGMAARIVPTQTVNPRKNAITYLEKNWRPKMKKDEAVDLLKKCLFECNPESHDKTVEISAFERNKKTETSYFKKEKK